MKIPFAKLGSVAYPFRLDLENMVFEGEVVKKNADLALLSMKMKGSVPHICDSCGCEIELNIDEFITLMASDGIYKDESHSISDVVEFFRGEIDINEVARSELESYLSDYFYCKECENKKEFDMEK